MSLESAKIIRRMWEESDLLIDIDLDKLVRYLPIFLKKDEILEEGFTELLYTKEVKERKKKINVTKKIKRKVVKNKKKNKKKRTKQKIEIRKKRMKLWTGTIVGDYTPLKLLFQLSMGEKTPLTILKLIKRRQIG